MWKNQQNKPCPVCFSSHYIALWLMTAEAVLSFAIVKKSKTAQHFQITAGWMKDAHLEQFRGKVVAVDAMCWSDAFREIDWIGCIAEATAACGNCPWGWKPLGCCFA